MSDIDVVILSWNRVEQTIQAINSSLEQEGVEVCVWLVDQGSEEENLQVLRNYAKTDNRINITELNNNIGVPAGRNYGISLGHAEFIVSLDNDAIFRDKNALKLVLDRFSRDANLAVIGFQVRNFFTGDYDKLSWVYPRQKFADKDIEFVTTRFCGAGHAIRRSAWKSTRGYDEKLFFYWEELDLSYQLINKNYLIIYYPSVVILHKISPEGRTDWRCKRYYYLVRNALYLDWKYFRSIKRIVPLVVGYLVKGIYNNLTVQAAFGIFHGLFMCKSLFRNSSNTLSNNARSYVQKYDLNIRGNILSRLKSEVLEILP